MNQAQIASFFVPRTQRFDVGGSGGIKTMSWEDVAAACAGKHLRFGWELVQARYARSGPSARQAAVLAHAWLKDEADRLGRKVGDHRRKQLAALAVMVYCDREMCPACRGGEHQRKGDEPCKVCKGSGVQEATSSAKSKAMGIKRQNWNQYEPLFRSLMAFIDQSEMEIAISVSMRLLGKDPGREPA